ncbi:unnamed protein product [Peronospora belbahrii]|uniref:ATPase AAA-type core domain-containing protein n=1 Tax=Peronospora belbahrii TaxID=622444 RepID=A0AAU9L5W2_9STRA|nr:unnamed protein product [Peronospora belbahrii]
MASQGFSSYLNGSTSETIDDVCRQDTVTCMSFEQQSLVEEIDTEVDDDDFDKKAHWSRRTMRKNARSSPRPTERTDKFQPSIALFCVKEQAISIVKKKEVEEEKDVMASSIAISKLEKSEAKKKKRRETTKKKKAESSGLEFDSVADTRGKGIDTSVVTSAGRPKRKAAIQAEILQQQQKLLDAVAARKEAAYFLTPPPSNKKKAEGNATTSGRKRKLEMYKKKMSSPAKGESTNNSLGANKTAQSFFLSEQVRKQLQEIEAVSSFREQLRQTREKDLAFFAGITANPFFQARTSTKPSSSEENEEGVVEICDDGEGTGEAKQQRDRDRGRWSKSFTLFPRMQHVSTVCLEAEDMGTAAKKSLPPKRALPATYTSSVVVVSDNDVAVDSRLPTEVMSQLQAAMNGQVITESSFSEQFWFREFLDASSLPPPIVKLIDVTSPRAEDIADTTAEELAERKTLLIDELVEMHGMREKRVRELLDGLEQARAKHLGREQNLSLVDRYLPVNASGLVGNRESLHTLSSWLSAWKVGGGDRQKLDCLHSELVTLDDGDSDKESEVGDLCRLFVLEGESGSGKSAAVYACAEELGYNIIEINAAQNRSGKSVVELAGEATQSTRVLHVGTKEDKRIKKLKKKRRRHSESRKSLEQPTAASLSLVMFEDVDLVFDEDKGFLNAVCSIAKHSKCPIVVTCAQLPDTFPTKPGRLYRELHKPSIDEFATWMRLVAFIEGLQLAPSLVNVLGKFFKRDVRRSLHFLEANLPVSDPSTKTLWQWQHDNADSNGAVHVSVPAWTTWSAGCSSFDAMTSNLLLELSAAAELEKKKVEDQSCKEKQAEVDAMVELAQIIDFASIAEVWMASAMADGFDSDDTENSFFLAERQRLAALELRRSSLQMLGSLSSPLGTSLMQGQKPVASKCVQRTLDCALAASSRRCHQIALAELKSKFDVPLAYKGCGNSEPHFALDYMPMVGRLLSSTGLQEGRRRTSRRNHYLGDVLGDMSLIDELPAFDTYLQSNVDQIVAASPTFTQ